MDVKKIILDVDLNPQQAKQKADALKEILTSLQNIPINNELTAQLEALSKTYAELNRSAKETIKTEAQKKKQDVLIARETRKTEEILRREKEKTRETTAKADLAEEKLYQTRKKNRQETEKSTEVNKKHEKGVLEMASGFIKWQAAATLVMQPLQKLRSLVGDLNETLVETEKSVVSLTRVAGEEANSDEIFDLAQKYGQSFENVAEVVERFAKSGYDWRDSIKAAESALVSMNVAELDASQATEGVIAILKQFQLEISELDTIIGILNKTADKYAVDTEELLVALQKTGSSAKNANLSLQETVGLITALSEGTAASGQNIGNALRSLFIFSSDKKALETFASLSNAMEETVRLYQAGGANILDVWRGLGNELSKLDNSKGMLSELFGGVDLDSDIASQLTQIEDQFAEIYGTAGNYRQNYFIALLDNIETATKAVEDMTDVESYSHKENELAMETYEKKLASLDAKWKELANDQQGILLFKKVLVDIGIGTLEVVEDVGGLHTVLLLAGTAASAVFGAKAIDGVKQFAKWIKTASTGATSASIALTSIMGVLTVIVGIVGVINDYYEELHEANQAAIDAANANREQLKTLEELEKKYNTLDKTSDEYKKTEQEIVSVLGDKAQVLEYLKGDQEAYTQAIQDTIDALKEEYKLSMSVGFSAAKSELSTYDVGGYRDGFSLGLGEAYEAIEQILAQNGLSPSGSLMDDNSLSTELNNYVVFSRQLEGLKKVLLTMPTNDPQFEEIASVVNAFEQRLATDKKYIEDYINTGSYLKLEEWLKTNELTSDDYYSQRGSATRYLLDELGLTESFYRPMIEDYIDEWARTNLDFTPKDGGTLDDTKDALEAIKNKYGDIRDELDEIFDLQKQENDLAEKQNKILEARKKLEEAREEARKKAILDTLNAERKGEEENLTLEERRLAVEKARKALEDAKRQRTVRVIDASTGTFGARIESAPEVAEAEEDLSSAVDALNQYIEDQAWDSVIEAVYNGTTELSEIRNILRTTLGDYANDLSKEERDAIESNILGAYEKGQTAEIDTSKIESAESSVTDAEKAYQEHIDQSLQKDVDKLLNSGKDITTTDLRVILKEYEKRGASKQALDAVSNSFLKYMNMTSEEFWQSNEKKSFWGTVKNQMAEAMSKKSLIEEYGFPVIASQNGWLYEEGKKTPTPTPIYNTNNTGNVTQYFVNGVPVPVEAAQTMTIEEFCREYRLITD